MQDIGGPNTYTVILAPGGERFATRPDQSILEAAAASGIEMASSCRNGTCRTCICQLTTGEVRYLIEWPGLLPEEKSAGWILPCVAHACSDLSIAWPVRQ